MVETKNEMHLFVCGCPRSGTTALWRLLASDQRIRIGVERYGNKFFTAKFISPSDFEKDRFFDLKPGDTFYENLDDFNSYYSEAKPGYEDAIYVGDKIPLLFRYFDKLKKNFPDAKVIFIFRNIFDVANSYKVRVEDSEDSWNKSVSDAVNDWNESLAQAEDYSDFILCADYENLFFGEGEIEKIYKFLDLSISDEVKVAYKNLCARSNQLEEARARNLTALEVKTICNSADFTRYRRISEMGKSLTSTSSRYNLKTLSKMRCNAVSEKAFEYQCNLCGSMNLAEHSRNDRTPGPKCEVCNSSTRFRFVGWAISTKIFGGDGRLYKDIDLGLSGIGLSDAPPLANVLGRFEKYTNTFYHKAPMLDIMATPQIKEKFDFLISSDVFEHTPPPVETPFENAFSLLRSGGFLVLSVPTQNTYVEHFPTLFEYYIKNVDGRYRLVNKTTEGESQLFDELRFHGGPGNTLEMRIFSVPKVEESLRSAGFECIDQLTPNIAAYGIFPIIGLSSLWIARKI